MIQAMKSLLNKKIRDSKGYTIIELMLVVLLMLMIVTLVSGTYILSINTSRDIIEITTSEIDARVAIYRISKDLREAANISIAEDDEITFDSNVDTDEGLELVHYYINGSDLYRQIDGGDPAVVANYVIDGNLFTYYTEENTPEGGLSTPVGEADRGNIRLIGINVSIDQSGAESDRTMDLNTIIYLRNQI